MGGQMDEWLDVKAGFWTAYINKNSFYLKIQFPYEETLLRKICIVNRICSNLHYKMFIFLFLCYLCRKLLCVLIFRMFTMNCSLLYLLKQKSHLWSIQPDRKTHFQFYSLETLLLVNFLEIPLHLKVEYNCLDQLSIKKC